MESLIIKELKSLPDLEKDTILEWFGQKYNIKVKFDHELAIFNYDIDADFFNPVVQEARGIIINYKKLEVVCWPYRKFGNSHEPYADTIDWDHCRVEEKVDGSIIKLFFHPAPVVLDWLTLEPQGRWEFSTNSCINAADATTSSGKTFEEVIKLAFNYKDIPFEKLNKDYTYIFELVSPETQVVVYYPKTELYHIGTRNNKTGEEYKLDIGIKQPKVYDIHSLDDCISAAEALNKNANGVKQEGFVVVDQNWHRVKVKSPDYISLHHIWSNGNPPKDKLITVLRNKTDTVEDLCATFDRIAVHLKYYDYRITELEHDVMIFMDYVRGLYEEYGHDRKAVALQIKGHPLASFGFKALDSDITAKELLTSLPMSKYCSLIPDYIPQRI